MKIYDELGAAKILVNNILSFLITSIKIDWIHTAHTLIKTDITQIN